MPGRRDLPRGPAPDRVAPLREDQRGPLPALRTAPDGTARPARQTRHRKAPSSALFLMALCEACPMDLPVRPGDALSQPTRARVFALLGDLHRPAPTEELAAELKLHPNGVRLHLERLLEE